MPILTQVLLLMSRSGAISGPERQFVLHLLLLWLGLRGRFNFINLSRYSRYHEQTFRRHFARSFPWGTTNALLLAEAIPAQHQILLAQDASFVPKSGRHTAGSRGRPKLYDGKVAWKEFEPARWHDEGEFEPGVHFYSALFHHVSLKRSTKGALHVSRGQRPLAAPPSLFGLALKSHNGTSLDLMQIVKLTRRFAVMVVLIAGAARAASPAANLATVLDSAALDSTFGSGGKKIVDVFGKEDAAAALAIQSDGKIVVVGITDNLTDKDFAVLRLNPNGSLDSTFDGDGKLILPMSDGYDRAFV